ncbi:MAG: hypothetical protein P8L32_03580 [Paracoccaceae bacterium]|jgi:hypothetical protein|nr:hypothetical protein [Paracoccaceae bacterium]
MKNLLILVAAIISLEACAYLPSDEPEVNLGDFTLGHNIIIAPNIFMGPGSREATDEELIEAVRTAVDDRLDPYSGGKIYNLGISVDGYVLADVGLPVVLAPKSALIIQVTVWDDAAGVRLNEEAHQIAVLEDFSAKTIIGSGLFSSSDQQLKMLSRKVAVKLEEWLEENNEWFGVAPIEAIETTIPEDIS